MKKQTIMNPLKQRKVILSKIFFKKPIVNTKHNVVNTAQEIIAMFDESRDNGYEGLVLKRARVQYHPGKKKDDIGSN